MSSQSHSRRGNMVIVKAAHYIYLTIELLEHPNVLHKYFHLASEIINENCMEKGWNCGINLPNTRSWTPAKTAGRRHDSGRRTLPEPALRLGVLCARTLAFGNSSRKASWCPRSGRCRRGCCAR